MREPLTLSATLPIGDREPSFNHFSEIDAMGMGRYQICIWFLTGFGYFLDLAWSQGVGLLATPIL